MTTQESSTKTAPPPYLTYSTFNTFIGGLRQAVPSHIDRSLMRSMSGASQSALLQALRYLKLIDASDRPTESLTRLATSEGPERQAQLGAVLREAYGFLFESDFDLKSATATQFLSRFRQAGVSGDTVRKASSFFIAAARDAGVDLSPYITERKHAPAASRTGQRPARASQKRRPRTPAGENTDKELSAKQTGQPPSSATLTWPQMLLSKFPSFDPAWPDPVKEKWFDAFDKLMTRGVELEQDV